MNKLKSFKAFKMACIRSKIYYLRTISEKRFAVGVKEYPSICDTSDKEDAHSTEKICKVGPRDDGISNILSSLVEVECQVGENMYPLACGTPQDDETKSAEKVCKVEPADEDSENDLSSPVKKQQEVRKVGDNEDNSSSERSKEAVIGVENSETVGNDSVFFSSAIEAQDEVGDNEDNSSSEPSKEEVNSADNNGKFEPIVEDNAVFLSSTIEAQDEIGDDIDPLARDPLGEEEENIVDNTHQMESMDDGFANVSSSSGSLVAGVHSTRNNQGEKQCRPSDMQENRQKIRVRTNLSDPTLFTEERPQRSFLPSFNPQQVVKTFKIVKNIQITSKQNKEKYRFKNLDSKIKQSEERILYVCDHCGCKYSDRTLLILHLKDHTTTGNQSVNCDRIQGTALSFERTGVESGTFQGKSCTSEFNPENVKPQNAVSLIKRVIYKCHTCGNEYMDKSKLKLHLITHTLKPFSCKTCGKCFNRNSALKTHSLVHTGERSFRCETCGKTFSQKQNLKTHSLIHAGVRSFKCKICGKCFSQKQILKSHSVVHTGEKSFKCETCGKSFSQKQNLRSHSKIHTGIKPYKCVTCGKDFTRKLNMEKHASTHTAK